MDAGAHMMSAGLVVRCAGQVLYRDREHFDVRQSGAHVETRLIQRFLEWRARNPLVAAPAAAGPPPDTKVTLYTHWSPCQSCLQILSTVAVGMIAGVGAGQVFFKVAFERYYTQQAHGGAGAQADYWPSVDEAKRAYEAASQNVGAIRLTRRCPGDDETLLERYRRAFVVKKDDAPSTTTRWE
jgi:hypothetical protein